MKLKFSVRVVIDEASLKMILAAVTMVTHFFKC